ncbi:chloroquine resistance transporter [Hepatocystis sp. ex Piliocolobus tephrosceles]|nr:chloroquine resistance transporter [Hepatocystis sp. ex Piliocolobus tephrosceles]
MTILNKKKKSKYPEKNGKTYSESDNLIKNEKNTSSELSGISRFYHLTLSEIKKSILVYLMGVCYIFICVMGKILAKRTLNRIGNYSFVTSQIHNFICLVSFFSLYFTVGRSKQEQEKQPNFMLRFFLIALLDGCSVIISFIGLTRTAGNIQSFVSQLSIPINMLFCFFILKYRYHFLNYLGALIIVGAIAIVEIFLSFETDKDNSIIFNMILITSLIPACFSNMTKEVAFKRRKINILHLNAVVSFFQIFTTFLILPVYSLPILKQGSVPFFEIGKNIRDGFNCIFFGQNTIVEQCGAGMTRVCDRCEGAWKIFLMFSFFNICDNIFMSYIIEKFSIMTYTIVNCLQGPAMSIAYYFKFLADDVVRQPRVLDFVTLVTYFTGSIIYRIGNIILERKKTAALENRTSETDNITTISLMTE